MRLDTDGFLYFVDRAKDMIKPGGENVYSIEVEAVLLRHPHVVDCAVVGVPDGRWGEAVKAIVVIAPGAPTTIAELDAHCLTHMAPYKRPRWYELADAIPRTHMNKIIKRDLRAAHDPARRDSSDREKLTSRRQRERNLASSQRSGHAIDANRHQPLRG